MYNIDDKVEFYDSDGKTKLQGQIVYIWGNHVNYTINTKERSYIVGSNHIIRKLA